MNAHQIPPPEPPFDVWGAITRWRAAGRRFALLTVVESRGFTLQKPGVHMLVGECGETAGTIGGGAIEHECVREARALLRGHDRARTVRKQLTTELGMCCGGEMSVFLEAVLPAPRLHVFGAGYIAKPLAAIAVGCGFDVTVVDARPEWATSERFPTSTLRVEDAECAARSLETTPEDFVVIVTHDHALDQRIVQALIRKPLRFLGMIGSTPKQRKFALRLKARGYGDEEIGRLHTPVGLAIGAATPEEIAVSVIAQLVAVRRGAAAPPGWVPPPRREQSGGGEVAAPAETAAEAGRGADVEMERVNLRTAAHVGRPEGSGATAAPSDREVRR